MHTTDQPLSNQAMAPDRVADLYEPLVAGARNRFRSSPVVELLLSADASPEQLDSFLIQFCALGVQMTEPVEGWIERAGLACIDMGMIRLGEALIRHAVHERDHHELMIADTHTLVELWNGLGRPPKNAAALLAAPPSAGVAAYVDLHEATIAGTAPYGQLAIEYEIERLSVTTGVELMTNVGRLCGPDRIEALSFLSHHVELDVGHTVFNHRQLDDLLDESPNLTGAMARAGSAALDAYGQFLLDCLTAADGAEPPRTR